MFKIELIKKLNLKTINLPANWIYWEVKPTDNSLKKTTDLVKNSLNSKRYFKYKNIL